jgi:hypothetical protein
MIQKPPQNWQRRESAAVGMVRASASVASSGVAVARAGTFYMRALFLWGFAALWGFVALMAGAAGSFPTFLGVGAMAISAGWAGRRMMVKARMPR